MEHLYWVGIKESEIRSCTNLFKGSVTYNGTGENGNISYVKYSQKILNYNTDSNQLDAFIKETLLSLIADDSSVRFMFYNPYYAYFLGDKIIKHTIGVNERYVLNLLRDKMKTRLWLSNTIPVLKSIALSESQCSMAYFKKNFPGCENFILQGCTGAGGNDTYVINERSWDLVKKQINAHEIFLLSPYVKPSFSINVRIIIGKNITITPASIQIVEKESNRLIYHGSDFVEYNNIANEIKVKAYHYSMQIAELVKNIGYKGILGVDYLICGNDLYFLEINPRFQSSTPLLNTVLLKEYGLTLQNICLEIFKNSDYTIPELQYNVPYSAYIVDAYPSYDFYDEYIKNAKNSDEVTAIFTDGYTEGIEYEECASIYSVVLDTNITTINPNGTLNIHENIRPYKRNLPKTDTFHYSLDLKTKLFSQGIRLSQTIRKMIQNEGYRRGTYSSIDIYLHPNLIMNTPVDLKLCSMSPFEICFTDNVFWLLYAGKKISPIKLAKGIKYSDLRTKMGIKYEDLSFLATDRLRLHHSLGCHFKKKGCGCLFCDVPEGSSDFNKEDIIEIADWHIINSDFQHILIGGGSQQRNLEYVRVVEIIKYLRSKTNKPIYLMALPPENLEKLSEYYKAGLTDIAFNIEIFDQDIRKKYMSGKGSISLDTYKKALLKAVELWGNRGNVKSLVIYGLESDTSYLAGIKWLASHGIQPIISVFRPLQNTEMKNRIPPESLMLKEIFYKTKNICQTYHLNPGPDCIYCQNNTLSLSIDIFYGSHN